MVEAKKEEEKKGDDGQKNASERINLQHIMELREAFESADVDGGNSLDEDEVSWRLRCNDPICLVYAAFW